MKRWIGRGCAALFLLLFAGAALAPVHWIFDLIAQFLPLWGVAAIAACALCAALLQWRSAGLIGAGLIATALINLPFLLPSSAPTGAPIARLAHVNIWFSNRDPAKLMTWLHDTNPDIVTVVETHSTMHRALLADAARPYFLNPAPDITQPMHWPGETAIASRWPLRRLMTAANKGIGFGFMAVRVEGPTPFTLVSLHLTRPWPFDAPDAQMRQVEQAISLIQTLPRPLVLTGDFNAAPNGRVVRRFAEALDLNVAAGLGGTWMDQRLPHVGPSVRLPIDHVLADRSMVVGDRTVSPFLGSDHRGVTVTLRAPATTSPKR